MPFRTGAIPDAATELVGDARPDWWRIEAACLRITDKVRPLEVEVGRHR